MSLHLRYRFSKAQHQGSSGVSFTDAEILIEAGRKGTTAQLTSPTRREPVDLVKASESTFTSVMAGLPSGFEKDLTVETGIITEELSFAGKAVTRKKRAYTLASCHGVVIILKESLGAKASSPWTKRVPQDETIKTLPLVLGPSAALAVTVHMLEFSGAQRDLQGNGKAILDISELDHSPYPPQSFVGLRLHGKYSRLADWKKSAPSLVTVKPLLVRYELWSRPFAALFHDGLRHWAISCDTQVPWPSPVLILDTLTPLDCCPGKVEWEATYSVRGEDGVMAGGCGPLHVQFEARQLLGSIYGATGELMPACVDDPIAGKQFGLATPLVSDVLAHQILSNCQ